MDHFYFGKSALKPDENGQYNFDEPASVDLVAFAKAVKSLQQKKPTTIPVYNMVTSERTGTQTIEVLKDAKFLVVEGIFSFHEPVGSLGDLKIYLDTPTEIRVARRMIRDEAKGRSDIETLSWSITVEKYHQLHVAPMNKLADLVIPFSYNPVQFTA